MSSLIIGYIIGYIIGSFIMLMLVACIIEGGRNDE